MNSLSKSRNQILFFTALLLSAFGYEFVYFIMTLHIYDLSKSALNIGVFTSLTYIPKLFSSWIGGLSDKVGKARCFAFSALMTALLLLLMSSASDIRWIYIIWFVVSIFFTVIINTRGSLMAEIVTKENYTSGNALALSLLNTAKLLGPFFGGLIVMLLDIKPLLIFTFFVYVVTAAGSFFIGAEADSDRNAQTSFLENAKSGMRFISKSSELRKLTLIAFFWRLFLGMQLSLFVIYIKSELHATDAQYGFFITLMGIGCFAGSVLGPFAARHIKQSRLVPAGLSLHYASFAALGMCKNYYLSLAIIAASYMVFYITLVTMHSVRDQVTAVGIRGSVYGTVTTLLTPPAILSMLAGSYLTDQFSVSAVLFASGLCAMVSLFLILFFSRGK